MRNSGFNFDPTLLMKEFTKKIKGKVIYFSVLRSVFDCEASA